MLAGQDSPAARLALEMLCAKYWHPLYSFLRYSGRSPHHAQDLCQEFFVRLLRQNSFASADPRKGKFRTFLLGALKHFLADEKEKAHAAKRGGDELPRSLDWEGAEQAHAIHAHNSGSPDKLFDRRWGLLLLEHALLNVRGEFIHAGKEREYEVLKAFIAEGPEPDGYAQAAAALGLSERSVAVAVHRMRQRYPKLVCAFGKRASAEKMAGADGNGGMNAHRWQRGGRAG